MKLDEPWEEARLLFERGRELMDAGRYSDAAEALDRSQRLAVHFKTLELWGECLMHLALWQQAIVPRAAAATLNSGARAPCLLAEALLMLGDAAKAEEIADLALQRAPGYRRALSAKRQAASQQSTDRDRNVPDLREKPTR